MFLQFFRCESCLIFNQIFLTIAKISHIERVTKNIQKKKNIFDLSRISSLFSRCSKFNVSLKLDLKITTFNPKSIHVEEIFIPQKYNLILFQLSNGKKVFGQKIINKHFSFFHIFSNEIITHKYNWSEEHNKLESCKEIIKMLETIFFR